METKTTYTLDAEKLSDAIAILDSETNELRQVVQLRHKSLPLIKVTIYIFIAGAAALWLLTLHQWIFPEAAMLYGLIFFAAYMLTALLLSYPSMRAFYRLRRVQRSLGLEPEKHLASWQEARARIRLMIPSLVGFLALNGSAAYFFIWEEFNPWIFDVGILSHLLGLVISANLIESRSSRMLQERLQVAEQLRASLLSRQKSSSGSGKGLTISVPEAEYKEIARIERALVNLERARLIKQISKNKTIALGVNEPRQGGMNYVRTVSLEAEARSASFPPELQLRLAEITEMLTRNPRDFENRTKKSSVGKDFYVYQHPNPPLEVTYQLVEDVNPRIIKFVHFAELKITVKRTLFISYSHEDKDWLDKILKFLKGLESHDISLWTDRQILAGDRWQEEIDKALADAKAALLLVSQDFLNSDFIKHKEIPFLLKKAETVGLKIFWVPVRPSTVVFENNPIAQFQAAVDDPEISIFEMGSAQQERQFVNIHKKIVKALAE